jgi:cyclohexanone monooxygenase
MENRAQIDLDVAIIGAGFAGIAMLSRLRDSALTARIFDGSDRVGGTWSWNTYPGARTDNESWYYCYSYPEIYNEWRWPERYATQAQVQSYLEFVVDRFGLRDRIQLNTRVTSATFDEDRGHWIVVCDDASSFTARTLVAATGLLSVPFRPEFPGLDSFQGEHYWASLWPRDGIDYEGKRVGVIGGGSTAVQMIPTLAEKSRELYVIQRTPQFVLEARNRRLDTGEMDDIKARYHEIWRQVASSPIAMDIEFSGRLASLASERERREVFEAGWALGGFRFLFTTFDDLNSDLIANTYAADFIRAKIRETVDDPSVAERLIPRGYPLGAKRVIVGHDYYEVFNRPNVTLLDLSRGDSIQFTADGISCGGRAVPLDIAILATGFDAYTGALDAIDIRGRGGRRLKEKWATGLRTYLGVSYEGFPNLFAIDGPHSAFANIPTVAQRQADWIGDAIEWLDESEYSAMEPLGPAEDSWTAEVADLGRQSLIPMGETVHSWFYGANIPGKTHEILVYAGSAAEYAARCRREADDKYPGFGKHI